MSKLHSCPECGRSHTGLTLICGDCLYEVRLNQPVADKQPHPRWLEFFKDGRINVTLVGKLRQRTNVTLRGFGTGSGRPRVHKDNAEKQRAWRHAHANRVAGDLV